MNYIFFSILVLGVVFGGTLVLPDAFAQLPPDPPKLLNATVSPSHGITFLWQDGNTNGDTHVNFQIQRLFIDGVTWKSLGTTTSNTFLDNEPQQNATAKYRIRDNGNLGFGCYQFAMNTTVTNNLQSYYPFCNTTNDNGILGNDGVVTGTEQYDSSGVVSFDFDGSSFVTLPNESDYDYDITDPFSIGFWMKTPPSFGVEGGVVKSSTLGGASGFKVYTRSAQADINFRIADGTNSWSIDSGALSTSTIYHVVATYDGSSNQNGMKLYLNGTLESTGISDTTMGSILNNDSVVIGADSAGNSDFNGLMNKVGIWNKTLAANEIEQLYHERIDTSTLAMRPNAVTDLTATPDISTSTATLSWSEPFVFGGVDGYQINYTTPFGDPLTIVTGLNNTESTDTTQQIFNLIIGDDYSFRVSPWNDFGNNVTGNIANATIETDYVIGNLSSPDVENTDDFDIFFERTDINSTSLFLNVTYPNTYNMSCNFYYEFARTNNTYSNLASTVVDSSTDESSFLFVNATGDIITATCYDENSNDTAKYILTITQFPFLDQIDNMKNGTYGTYFEIGAIDGITIMVVFLSMIGFNRTSPIAGIFFLVTSILVLSFFGIITYPAIMYPAFALMMVWAFMATRKDD